MSFKALFRKKPLQLFPLRDEGLLKCLKGSDLALIGIGAIIGAGIFVLTGIAAATKAGPAVIYSFILAGLACGFSAFAYAELSSSIGGSGGAYTYSYTGLGEIVAWIIGWALLLEYGLGAAAVSVGWSAYFHNILMALGVHLPIALTQNPFEGGIVNLPAIFIVLLITYLLSVGVRESMSINRIIVIIKLAVIVLFIILASFHFHPSANWHPFLPFGWSGVAAGASLVFFAYIGFDAVSTAAEETINPQKDLPFGILVSLIVCTILYILVSGLLTAAVPYTLLNVSSPIAQALLIMGYRFGGAIVAVGAIAGLTSVILVLHYGLTRIFYSISRDGLFPAGFAHISSRTKTPLRVVIGSGIVIMIIAGFFPLQRIAEMVNIGTLAAFSVVCLGVITLRITHPELERPFKTPFSPLIPALGFIFCGYLMLHLPGITWLFFLIWMVLGLIIYFIYGFRHSHLRVPTLEK